jgi:radical SAM superfamily enzyme YgiQ (UPF0313 family)
MKEFCDKINFSGLAFVWGCQTRINGFSQEEYKYMYDAGCRWIYFGIESGSRERLIKVKKGIDYDKIMETVANCYNAGIVTISGFIVGFPGEDENELRQTIKFAKAMPFTMWAFHHFIPVPGSELYYSLVAQKEYILPSTLSEMVKMSPADEIIKNFSNIPTRELNVVWTYFMMSTLVRKKPNQTEKSFGFAVKIVKEQLLDMAKGGFIGFFKNFALTAKTFLTYIYYFFFFPKIRKKYDLYPDKTNTDPSYNPS